MNSPPKLQCVSDYCDREVDPSWDFCPYCGCDNRPPSRKGPVRFHAHKYLHRSGCCTRCGEPIDEPYVFKRKWRMQISGFLLALSLLAFLSALNIGLAGVRKPAIAAKSIQSWYDITITRRSRRYGTRTTTLGRDWILNLMIVGAVCGGLGGLMLFKQPLRWIDKRDGW